MTDKIEPALTVEEWAEILVADSQDVTRISDDLTSAALAFGPILGFHQNPGPHPSRHGLAALALHGQPYGFTDDDILTLRSLACHLPTEENGLDRIRFGNGVPELLYLLASRIEALLPPEPE